jgi:hypothetical protein
MGDTAVYLHSDAIKDGRVHSSKAIDTSQTVGKYKADRTLARRENSLLNRRRASLC